MGSASDCHAGPYLSATKSENRLETQVMDMDQSRQHSGIPRKDDGTGVAGFRSGSAQPEILPLLVPASRTIRTAATSCRPAAKGSELGLRSCDLHSSRHQLCCISGYGAVGRVVFIAHHTAVGAVGREQRNTGAAIWTVVAADHRNVCPRGNHPHRHQHVVPVEPGSPRRAAHGADGRLRCIHSYRFGRKSLKHSGESRCCGSPVDCGRGRFWCRLRIGGRAHRAAQIAPVAAS